MERKLLFWESLVLLPSSLNVLSYPLSEQPLEKPLPVPFVQPPNTSPETKGFLMPDRSHNGASGGQTPCLDGWLQATFCPAKEASAKRHTVGCNCAGKMILAFHFQVFVENLEHKDSFVYLSAIQGKQTQSGSQLLSVKIQAPSCQDTSWRMGLGGKYSRSPGQRQGAHLPSAQG